MIYGPSGCGKTTLLYCLAMLQGLDSGEIKVNGLPLEEARKNIGVVFQDLFLWDNKTIMKNLLLAPLLVKNKRKEEVKKLAMKICTELMLEPAILNRYPSELSRGQRQRVAIARTLLMEPEIILLDEIDASLDENLTEQVAQIIRLLKNKQKTIILITHDKKFGRKIGDKFIDLTKISLTRK